MTYVATAFMTSLQRSKQIIWYTIKIENKSLPDTDALEASSKGCVGSYQQILMAMAISNDGINIVVNLELM